VAAEAELTDKAREGIDHLQAAAKELIAAGRALLDAAEELVDDPGAAAQLLGVLGTITKLAGNAAGRVVNPDGDDADPGEDGPRIQRIRVS
jgi:hypothetical protein